MTPIHPQPADHLRLAMQHMLAALADHLELACIDAVEAHTAMQTGERNLAIGTMLPLERMLPECAALVSAVRILHGWANRLPDDGAK